MVQIREKDTARIVTVANGWLFTPGHSMQLSELTHVCKTPEELVCCVKKWAEAVVKAEG